MAQPGFQTQVSKDPAIGVPGDKASLNVCIYTDRNYVAGDGKVTIGQFVWFDPSNPTEFHGTGILNALSTGAAGAKPLGIVQRNLSAVNYDIMSGATMVVPEGSALNVVIKGDLYAQAATAATRGQKVFAVLADGSLKTGAAGATIAGAIETSFEVKDGGDAGDLITISSWGV